LGIELDSKTNESLCIETTTIGSGVPFDYALQKGNEQYIRDLPYIKSHKLGYNRVLIQECRLIGVNSIPTAKDNIPALNFGPIYKSKTSLK
jgi:hypothetical protein